jgi:hypothetical protein
MDESAHDRRSCRMSQSVSRREVLATGAALVGGAVSTGLLASRAVSAAEGQPAKGTLTIATLGNLLAAINIKATKTESRYDFAFEAKHGEEWNLSMSVVLSTDEKTIWLMAWLDELPQSSADVPRTALLRLLSDNDKMGNGQFFAYVSSNRRFVLQRVIENANITSASFRTSLLELGATVVNTFPHWAVTNWKQGGNVAPGSKQDPANDDLVKDQPAGKRTGGPASARTATKDSGETGPRGTRKQ